MLVFSPTTPNMVYAMRLVRPVFVKTRPITTEAKMNRTDGSMKSLNASSGVRIKNRAWSTPIAMLVTPMGSTSNTHQVPASMNTANAPLASRLRGKCLPMGSTASGQGGE